MGSTLSEYIIVFVTAYALTALFLLAYKAALNDLYHKTRRQLFREARAVHPLALLSGAVAMIPLALVHQQYDSPATTFGIVGGVTVYFLLTLVYRKLHGLKILDFSIDNGSNFNDEISADPTWAQKLWLFIVSWAGALIMGTMLGFVIGYNSWKDSTDWLTDQPSATEARAYVWIFSGILVLSLVAFAAFRSRRLRRLPTAARVRRAVNRAWFVPALFGLMIALLMDFTRNQVLTNRYWVVAFFVWIGVVELWNLIFIAPNAKRHLREDRKFFEEQQKRLRRQRNKKRRKGRR